MQRVLLSLVAFFVSAVSALGPNNVRTGHLDLLKDSHPEVYRHIQQNVRGPTKFVQSSGTNYIFAFPNSHIEDSDTSYTENLTLTITNTKSDQDAQVSITSSYVNFTAINITVPAGDSRLVFITPVDIQVDYRDIMFGYVYIEQKAVFLTSSVPVEVVASNTHTDGYSGESYAIIPTCQLGKEYRTVSDESVRLGAPSTNIITVVATEDNTTTWFNIIANGQALLNRGDTLAFVIDAPLTNFNISADKNIAVLAAAVCGFGYFQPVICDHEVVMLSPTNTWGTEFPVSSFIHQTQFEIIILSKEAGTEIYRDGVYFNFNLSATQYLMATDYQSRIYTTSKPAYTIVIGNFNYITLNGAPFFEHIPSPNQWTNESVQFTPGHVANGNHSWVTHYVRITTDLSSTGKLSLDGIPVNALAYQRYGRSTYYYADVPIAVGTHVVSPSDGVRFTVTVYGFGFSIGYAFTPGLDLPANGTC